MTFKIHKPRPLALMIAMAVAFAMHCTSVQAKDIQVATVAGGCFLCVESDFESVPGVVDVVSGYTGGTTRNPTYKQVTRGGSGHYEAVEITYDADQISYDEILRLFFRSVDPTDAGGQFCDRGESYRTAIFVSSASEKAAAEAAKAEAQAELGQTIVTPILDAARFYKAEAFHQDYYKRSDFVLTRRGPKTMEQAYKFYRNACGRDKRIEQLWGSDAPFIG